MSNIGVGSTIWRFDPNRRVYPKPETGRILPSCGPIYREHWVPVVITGETSRSWLWGHRRDVKIPKRGPHPGFAFTQEEVDDDVWARASRHRVSRAVEHCQDVTKLRQVAAILGVEEARTL
jgi:hypothetical protein